jgi:hypothetical protein
MCANADTPNVTVSVRSIICIFTTLFTTVLAIESAPIEPVKTAQKVTLPNEAENPNLRKILYPTYSREPFEMKFYSGADVPNKAFGLWGPSNLFDRNLRSPVDYSKLNLNRWEISN